ncbi:MAG: NADH-quinone oxidoreductase subunit D [Elusimicrobiota bacterium]
MNSTEKLQTETMYINMGPQHPSTHGVLRLGLTLDGEVVTAADPDIGYLHRGIEKLAEKRNYFQFNPLTDRLDYLASMSNNLAYCLTVEKILGVAIPPRAQVLRVIMAELQRIASHLVYFGTYGVDLGAVTPFMYAFRDREVIVDLFESVCGARLTYNYIRIGGAAADLPEGFVEKTKIFIQSMGPHLQDYDNLLSDNAIFLDRTKGIGIISGEKAIAYGLSGPNLRASGIKFDLRKDEPYSGYDQYNFAVPVGTRGDCWDRYYLRMSEIRESLKIVEQALNKLPSGEYLAKVPKVLKVPAGETYQHIESPRGDLGFYLVSDGTEKPYRLKIRAPSFVNLQILGDIMPGGKIADIVAILGSIDIVLGEVDR